MATSKFTDLFIHRPKLAIIVGGLILLLGITASIKLPLRQFPLLESATITITTTYPGGGADLMQGFVTVPLAEAITSVSGLEYISSTSMTGKSVIDARLKLNADSNQALTEIMAKISSVKYRLPKGAYDPIISKSTGEPLAIAYIGFSSTDLSIPQITDYLTRVVQPIIASIPGVSLAEVSGGQNIAMRIWLDASKMAARGISAEDVGSAIREGNFQAAPGQAKGALVVTNLRATTDLTTVNDFKKMVVKSSGDSVVRLEDIATVELGAQTYDQSALMNGDPAVYISVYAGPLGNPLEIVAKIRAALPSIVRSLPPSMKIDVPFEQARFVQASIHEVVKALIISMLIVISVIYIFLGSVRSVLIPVVTIPLSLIGTAFLMDVSGFSLNLLTFLAMVMAIGLVVDDAIVVLENICRHMEDGEDPLTASLKGAREIVGPIICMTITLAAVYAPIGFMGGLTGALFKEFAFTLAGSVIVSGIVALVISPMMCAKLLSKASMEHSFTKKIENRFKALSASYGKSLNNTLKFMPLAVFLCVAIILSSWKMYGESQRELAPAEDQGIIFTAMKGPQSASIDYTEAYTKQISTIFHSFPETTSSFVRNGLNEPNDALAGFLLAPWEERSRSVWDLLPVLQEKARKVEGVSIYSFLLAPLPGSTGGLPVQMVINSAQDYRSIYESVEKLKAAARASGMFFVVDSDLDFNNPVANIRVNRAMASNLGISMESIGNSLALLVGGNYINRFNLEGRSYDVITQVSKTQRLSADDLGKYYLTARNGELVPLSSLITVERAIVPNYLMQFNQMNSATLKAMPVPGVAMGDAVRFLSEKADEILPEGFSYDWLGDSRQYVQEGNKLVLTFALALLVIYMVLVAQFESFTDPLIILGSVPLSIFGALIPIYLGFATLNIYTEIGMVTLIGMISKHGILMVDFANKLLRQGNLDRRSAIVQAARVRLRPILMTTAAMVVGVFPLLLAEGAGSACRYSIGIVIVMGMLIGTPFTLYIVPALYVLMGVGRGEASVPGSKSNLVSERQPEIRVVGQAGVRVEHG